MTSCSFARTWIVLAPSLPGCEAECWGITQLGEMHSNEVVCFLDLGPVDIELRPM